MKKEKNIMRKVVIASLFVVVSVFCIDYFNIFTTLGIKINSLNAVFWGIFLNNGVVIALFYITYLHFDKRNIEKENNKRKTALIMLKNTYNFCNENIRLFNDKEYRANVAKKCDFDELICTEPFFLIYRNQPFENHDAILNFSKEGVITPHEYETYLDIESKYKNYINYAISLYDNYSAVILIRDPLKSNLNTALKYIIERLN